MSAQNKWRKMRKGTIACIALAASVSMVAGAGAAGAQANMAPANPLASIAASLDPQTKTVLGDVMAQAMDPMLGALRNSTSQVGVDTVDTDAGEETSVTWRVDTGSLAESLGGEVSTDKELAMIAMPRGVVSSGDVTVTRVSVDDSGQEVRTEIPVSDMGSVEEGVRGAVLGPVATVHEMTSPEAVTIYGHILRELARGGTLESLAPLAGDLAAAAGVEVPEVVDPAAMTRGQAEAMVPQLMAMQNVLTGENPLDVLLGDTSVPTVEHANLMVDVAPGDVLEIKTTGDAKIVDQKVTALLPHSMIAGANSMINAAATQASNTAGAATAPQLPVIPGLPQVSDLQALLTPSSNKTANAVAGSVGAPDEFVFQTYSGPVGGTGFVQTQLPTGALDPSMFMDILGPLLSEGMLESVFGTLESVLGNDAALGDIFGAISGEGGDIAPGQLATSLLAVISELATGIIPALSEAITEMDPSKLTDFINEVISQGGLDTEIPGITNPLDPDDTTGGTGTDGTGTDTTGDGTGTDGTGTEASDDIGDKISVNEAFEIYDLVAAKIDERGSSTGSTSQNKQVSNTTTREDSDGTDPDPEGASSPDRSETSGSSSSDDDYGSSGSSSQDSSQESANYNTAAQESLPVTGASAYTAYYAAGGLLLLVVSATAYFGGFGRIKNWVGRSK